MSDLWTPPKNEFTDALLSKINGIESGATADQIASEIKTLLVNQLETTHLSDDIKSKVSLVSSMVDCTGTVTILSSSGLSSITDNGIGTFGFNFNSAFNASLYYCVYGSGYQESTARFLMVFHPSDGTRTTGACDVVTSDHLGDKQDGDYLIVKFSGHNP